MERKSPNRTAQEAAMDEDSGGESSNSSAKRSKLDTTTADGTDISMSAANSAEVPEDCPETVPNTREDDNNAEVSAPAEGSACPEAVQTVGEPSTRETEGQSSEQNQPSTSTPKKNFRMRLGGKPKNYRARLVISSSSEDSDDNPGSHLPGSGSSSSSESDNLDHLPMQGDNSDSSVDSFPYPNMGDIFSDDSRSNSSEHSVASAVPEILQTKVKPNYSWNVTRDVMYREHGLTNQGRSIRLGGNPIGFQSRFYGALHIVEKMGILHHLEKHQGCVNSLHFNKAGDLLVSGSDDLKIILWDWASGKMKCSISSGHNSNVFQTKFVELRSSINIISSGRDGQVRQFMIPPSGASGTISKILLKHTGAVHKIALSPSCPHEIFTAGEDGHVVRCDLRESPVDRVVTVKVKKRKVPLYSIAHHPFDPEFCVCGRDQFVRVYDKRNTRKPLHMMCPQHLEDKKAFGSHITCAVYNTTGTEIVASYSDEDIYLFNNKCYLPGHYSHRYRGHNNNKTIKGVNFFGLNSEYVVSGSDCGNFFFWDKNTESIVNWIKGDSTGVVNCLEAHPTFPVLATSGLDHDVKIWVPLNEEYPPKMEGLAKCVKHNMRRTVFPETDLFDDRTFLFFVRECLRNRRPAPAEDNCPNVQDLVSSSSGEEDGCGPDDDNVQFRNLPCTPQ